MASERDRPTTPGWYWCQLDYVSSWSPHHTDYIGEDAEYLTWGPPCTGYPGAERPDAPLRERLGAALDAMHDDAKGLPPTLTGQCVAGALLEWCDRLRALLTEGQPPHPALSADEAYAIMRQINTIAGDWRGDTLDGHEAIVRVRAVLATKEK
jgi:hypothetical protein